MCSVGALASGVLSKVPFHGPVSILRWVGREEAGGECLHGPSTPNALLLFSKVGFLCYTVVGLASCQMPSPCLGDEWTLSQHTGHPSRAGAHAPVGAGLHLTRLELRQGCAALPGYGSFAVFVTMAVMWDSNHVATSLSCYRPRHLQRA